MEAQAHQIYWAIGAESSDEIREKVLGLSVNPEERIPRTIDNVRLGIIPLAHVLAISGEVDPLTGAPKAGSVQPQPYELPGGGTPVPAEGPQGGQPQQAAGGRPKANNDPTKAYPRPLALGKGASNAEPTDETPAEDSSPAKDGPGDEFEGYGRWSIPGGSTAQGIGATGGAMSVEEAEDLRRWQRQSRDRVKKGRSPREFSGSAIRPSVYGRIWSTLSAATTREQVDEAFTKAKGPQAAGIVVQALDTGRVLMVRRSPDKHDPGEAYARWEFPGGNLTGDDPWSGALREWSEETGGDLPPTARHTGNWASPDGVYVGHVVTVPSEHTISLRPTGEEVSEARWWSKDDLGDPAVRHKVTETLTRVTPLLKGWTAQPRNHHGQWTTPHRARWQQFHRHTDRIVEHYSGLIQAAMTKQVTRQEALRVARRMYRNVAKATTGAKPALPPVTPVAAGVMAGGVGALAASGAMAAGGVTAIVASLRAAVSAVGASARASLVAVLCALYADAYLQGAHEAAQAANGSMPPWTVALSAEPGAWEPASGVARAAQAVAGTGLQTLLAQAGVVVQGVTHTQLERIGTAISQGIEHGFPIAQVESEIADIIDTAARANMIAETEYMRAMGTGSMDVYRRNGVPELEWLHEPGACERCMENVAASPQPTSNPRWPQGPIPVHPNTRCAVAPYYGSMLRGRS